MTVQAHPLPALPSDGVLAEGRVATAAAAAPVEGMHGEVLAAFWDEVQGGLRREAGERAFSTWLNDLHPAAWRNGSGGAPAVLDLATSTLFIKDYVEREYMGLLQDVVAQAYGRPVRVSIVVAPVFKPATMVTAVSSASPVAAAPAQAALPLQTPALQMPAGSANGGTVQGAGPVAEPVLRGASEADASTLDPRYTFETYVMGPNNQFAFAAAKRVAEEQTAVFNPFFIHGGVGLGKTHLMQAIGWELKAQKPQTRILYLSAEQFFMRFVRAIQAKNTNDFKDLCRGVDVLMVDDIQFIAGKDSTQEEFFHTFNQLVTQGKKVILTADKSPHELANIEERLKSRLGSGLTVEIHVPDVETRLAILQKKAEERDLPLAGEVLQFLAQSIQSNVRELEGALNRLLAFSKLTGSTISVEFARDQLRDLLRVQVKTVTINDIQQTVADFANVRLADLIGPRRPKELVEARQTAMWLAKQLTTKSYPDIGRAFGGRDHTTVMHAVNKIEDQKQKDHSLSEALRMLERKLTGR